jgi:hypothetical protein
MTTRRNLLLLAGGVAVTGGTAALIGARSGTEPVAAVPLPGVLLAESRDGLVVLGGARPGRLGVRAASSADGRFVYAISGGTELVRFDPADGRAIRSTTLGGGWLPRVVSGDGRACALGRTAAAVRPAGRARTSLLVVANGEQRTYEFAGVLEPDAFTRDDTGLFVLEWLPATAPDHYRVRLLDLAAGTVGPLFTRDKAPVPPGAEEEMRGDGRQAVLSPDGQVLYTLYTHQPGHRHTRDLLSGRPGNAHAFVHVLHLTDRWAYCLDLPDPFGTGPAAGHALAVTRDGRELAVVDVSTGHLAYADTTALTITRVGPAPVAAGAASLAFTPDGRRVLVGAGPAIRVIDHAAGTTTAEWPVPGDVRGLGVGPDGADVYCGGSDEVLWLDAASGAVRGRMPVPGLLALHYVR